MTISIITATYNAGKTLESAIQSLINQTYAHIEYIIVDGESTDDTLQIVEKYKPFIQHFVSEKDNGIYDALNKGIELATGEVIGILHADDILDDDYTIETVMQTFKKNKVDAVYGDLEYVQFEDPRKVIRYWKSKDFKPSLLKTGWMPPHPTLFVRKKMYESIGKFRLDFKIAADYDFILRLFSQPEFKSSYLPLVITRMRIGGTSNQSVGNIIVKMKEDLRALKDNNVGSILSLVWKNLSKLPQFLKRN